jgi:acyl dehydratase
MEKLAAQPITKEAKMMTVKPLTLEEYKAKVGSELGVSDWLLVSQERINQFADVTDDYQYIHIDAEKAAQTPFGGTIAHGLLTLSMLPGFSYQVVPQIIGSKMSINYGYNKIRFLAPVQSGKRIRGRFALAAVSEPKPSQIMFVITATVDIEGEDKPALIAECVTMVFV